MKKRSQQEGDVCRVVFGKIYEDLHAFIQVRLKAKMKITEALYIRQCYDVLGGILDVGDETSNSVLYLFTFCTYLEHL